ncbi:MAG: matrixin family metalloprotease [Oligoflexia bacterium]|nr:matrixin family metalloprotease [Oligoflexia bacterium]
MKIRWITWCAIAAFGLAGCNAEGFDSEPSARLGESCGSSDPDRLCLSLKYVVYRDAQGQPVVSEDEALRNLARINAVWNQCDIAFEIEGYQPSTAERYGLRFSTASSAELTNIRRAFMDTRTLLVVTTGTWSGTLGAGSANAWTAMPGSGTYGVVLEEPIGDYPNLIAHELGHYLGLGHVSDVGDVMNAVIYASSTRLTAEQCEVARATARSYWSEMLR